MPDHLQSGNKFRSAWRRCPKHPSSLRTGMLFLVLLILVYCLCLRTFLGHTVDKHPPGPSAFQFGHARTTNEFMSRHTISADSSADAVGSFDTGVKKERNDNHSGVVFTNLQGFPDQCKGPVGVQGAKAIARFDLTRVGPLRFLQEFKTPCWRQRKMGSQQFTLRCLPYAYLAGFPKCGSTDLYSRMVVHPDIVKTRKEPHWITRVRFSQKDPSSIDNYARDYGLHLSGVKGKRSIADSVFTLLPQPVRLPLGLYTVFIEDWFLRFPRDQILVVRLEDVSVDPMGEMSQIFKFLGLGQNLTADLRYKLTHLPHQNVGKQSQKKGPMLNKTRLMLDKFYRPYNRRLANVLGDEKYTWPDV